MSFFAKKKSNKKMTRLFFATDIHGSERTYRKFINAGKFYEANVIVMGGDIFGLAVVCGFPGFTFQSAFSSPR